MIRTKTPLEVVNTTHGRSPVIIFVHGNVLCGGRDRVEKEESWMKAIFLDGIAFRFTPESRFEHVAVLKR